MKFQAIIFDLDGTLIDSMGIWAQIDNDFLTSRNIKLTKNLFEDLEGGNSFFEVATHFKNKFNLTESMEEIIAGWMKIASHHYQNTIVLKPNVKEFLDFLKSKNIKMAIGTSNVRLLTETVLKKNNIFEYFEAIVTGENDIKGKPFPDIFLEAAKTLNVEPKNCLVIEDLVDGVKAAKAAEMSVWTIFDKFSEDKKDILRKLSDHYFENFSEMLDYISQKKRR
jgi:HAD superfamily hydrolase (TIGR01509 family)